ncbi:MAG: 5-methyltetrahydropteroyltriglutamate--homocysteine S-methyltransferase [Bacteroidota bacterium]
MKTNILGYPRIGDRRELKKACEQYWSGQISQEKLLQTGRNIKKKNWLLQKESDIDLIPSNDFSFYDQVLDMCFAVGAIPERYKKVILENGNKEHDLYFAMARGYQKDGLDITAMEMTKWFDTNYHYIVPEFKKDQQFYLFSKKILDEFNEAKELGVLTKPVIIGPVSFLLLGKEKDEGFHRIELLKTLTPVYLDIISKLIEAGVEWIQFDEPFLVLDLTKEEREGLKIFYTTVKEKFPGLKIMLATYFEGLKDNLDLAVSLPVCALHIDLVRCPEQLVEVLRKAPTHMSISLGVVNGRNIWKNNFDSSLAIIQQAMDKLGEKRIFIASSCSLIHAPCDLELENDEKVLSNEIRGWLAFAKQKVQEIASLRHFVKNENSSSTKRALEKNRAGNASRENSKIIHNQAVKMRSAGLTGEDDRRHNVFSVRREIQQKALQLPTYPTTTIGSFPQTKEVRSWRAKYKKNQITKLEYEKLVKGETEKTIRFQEEIGLDVLVHGEFERNDMVEYFGEKLDGFAFTKFGWVQSYGSRCVKPPIIYGDVSRTGPMTVYWSSYAQELTDKCVKGMLTGPVTMLQWSFVRDDQPRFETCDQIALAIRDEVVDLEKAGIKIVQIDEPALREGLPLRKADWSEYLQWAVRAFRIASSGVNDRTQIHSHMCYSEFNDIIEHIAAMDADVITIECSRSQMELLDAFAEFSYPNEIGPGVYDIHSPRIPSKEEMVLLLEKASMVIPGERLWVNPDCGLKTRDWKETQKALIAMVEAAQGIRATLENAII